MKRKKAQLYSNLEKIDLMIKEYLNMLNHNQYNKSFVISKIQKFLDNDGISSDKNYKLVKRILLPYVRNDQDRTDFSEILIWLFMQNAQYDLALKQAKALDMRFQLDGQEVYDLAEVFLDKKYYDLAIQAYDYILAKGEQNELFIVSNINRLYALTKQIKIKKINTGNSRYPKVWFSNKKKI